MSDLKQKVINSASFYNNSFCSFDYQLSDFNFRTLKPFFKGNIALELGPASGYMTKSLVNEFEQLHLVDGANELLKQIPDYKNVVKFNSFFEEFETKEKYDTIIMSHVLEHVKDPILILKKIYNWLAKDGIFLVSVPNAKSIHRLVAVEMGLLSNEYELNDRDHALGHYRVYDISILKEHIIKTGFRIVETGGIFLKPVSNAQIENNWTIEMIEGFYKLSSQFKENCAEIFVVCSK